MTKCRAGFAPGTSNNKAKNEIFVMLISERQKLTNEWKGYMCGTL